MAIIPQRKMFGWEEIEELGDLERLRLVIRYMPDEELMRDLESERGNGRDDYPVRGMWNSVLAGVVFQHPSVESLRRELLRNAQIRYLCGLEGVPPSWVYSRFLGKLLKREEMIDGIFHRLVEELSEALPGFGSHLAIDGKGISSHARPTKEKKRRDGRRDTDADFGKKVYRGKFEDGRAWEKVIKWFGYKLHLVVDADYELPVAYEVTRASVSDITRAPVLLEGLKERQPEIIKRCEVFLGDRGYDDTKLITSLWDEYRIKPVIDIRNMWRDGEDTRLLKGHDSVVHDFRGHVYCYCPVTLKRREMAYGGFEENRQCLKYRCPAKQYGIECKGREVCHVRGGVRVPLREERRIFTPIARASYRWGRLYRKRTAVERVNGRLDVSFGFEHHFIRGLAKMKLRCGLALCVMLAMALGRVKEKQKDKIRSLVAA